MPAPIASSDVAIIGASVAGSLLAVQLGRAGVATLLIDENSFPRRKVCGEGLAGMGVELINEALGRQFVESLPHQRFSRL